MLHVYFESHGGLGALVPKPLQVGRLRAGPRRGDQEVAAELEIERRKLRIVAVGERLDPPVGRLVDLGRRAQVEHDAAEEPLMVGHVGLANRCVALAGHAREGLLAPSLRVGAEIAEVHMAGRPGKDQRGRIGAGDFDRRVGHRDFAALGRDLQLGLEPRGRLDVGPVVAAILHPGHVADQGQAVFAGGLGRRAGWTLDSVAVKPIRPGCVGRDADGDRVVRRAGNHFAREGDPVDAIAGRRHGRIDVQLAAIVGRLVMPGKLQRKVAERLVGDLTDRHAHEVFRGQLLGLALLALEQQAADLGQVLGGALRASSRAGCRSRGCRR